MLTWPEKVPAATVCPSSEKATAVIPYNRPTHHTASKPSALHVHKRTRNEKRSRLTSATSPTCLTDFSTIDQTRILWSKQPEAKNRSSFGWKAIEVGVSGWAKIARQWSGRDGWKSRTVCIAVSKIASEGRREVGRQRQTHSLGL
jgi:hypothetical protein